MKRKAGEWPQKLQDLQKVFNSLCTIYTFLSTRKHVVPSVDMLAPTVEKELKRAVSTSELAQIAYLMPEDVVFDYIDSSQTLKKEDVYAPSDASQFILVFEFVDGQLKPARRPGGYDKTDLSPPTFTIQEMKALIAKRRDKFVQAVDEFLRENVDMKAEDMVALLVSEGEKFVPGEPQFVNPLDAMTEVGTGEGMRPQVCSIIKSIQASETYHGQIVENGHHEIPERLAILAELEQPLLPTVSDALRQAKRIESFYSHQAQAINAIRRGEHVIVSTSTSSGKSLIYQVPVLEALTEDPNNTAAIYIFPTKALAQDQRKSFQDFMAHVNPDIMVDTYDGDTPHSIRADIRNTAKVIFTNPDMIHTSILPNWKLWAAFLRSLKFVVVDELHVYNGLFGSHVAYVMRRLRRICQSLGNHTVQFVSCSATVNNPVNMMQRLFGVENVTLVDQDGSPHGKQHLLLWNTPHVSPNDPTSGRVSPVSEATTLMIKLISNNIRTIVFCRVRRMCEMVIKSIRQQLGDDSPLLNKVMSYRGGYSPADRRRIEEEMFSERLLGVVATNALELGIDIGNLDAVLVVGFPFSISSFRQQVGRAGRRNKDSLAVLVSGGGAVDQYYIQEPNRILDAPNVEVAVDLDNILLLESHVQCAAFELPVCDSDMEYFPLLNTVKDRLVELEDGYYGPHSRFLPWPSEHVSLRGVEEDRFAVVDVTNDRNVVIEQIEGSRSTFTLYEGGIFLHQGYPYLIQEFDPRNKLAKVRRVNVDWITRQRDFTDIDPLETLQLSPLNTHSAVKPLPVARFGNVRHKAVVFGFFKVDKRDRILDAVEVDNPPYVFDSTGFWIDIPGTTTQKLRDHKLSLAGAIHGAEHALMNLVPRVVAMLPFEMGTECKAKEKEFSKRETKRKRPARLVFYDSRSAGGAGICNKVFEFIEMLLNDAVKRIDDCECVLGCPACVCSENCKEDSVVISKAGARVILGDLSGHVLKHIPMGPEANLQQCTVETVVDV